MCLQVDDVVADLGQLIGDGLCQRAQTRLALEMHRCEQFDLIYFDLT